MKQLQIWPTIIILPLSQFLLLCAFVLFCLIPRSSLTCFFLSLCRVFKCCVFNLHLLFHHQTPILHVLVLSKVINSIIILHTHSITICAKVTKNKLNAHINVCLYTKYILTFCNISKMKFKEKKKRGLYLQKCIILNTILFTKNVL